MMPIQKIKENLKKKLSSKRYEHTIGVEYTSTCLAMRYGVDIEKARIAGLLHDCAKYLSSEDKISKCESYGIPVSDYERKNPELLHAKLGACFANEIYGVTDSEILSAIIWHTTGCPDMSLLDKIVFIADYIEANRDKAEDITIIDISEVSVLADYFIIADGSNRNQVQAMADSAEEALGRAGYDAKQIEGYQSANWILMDYKDIIVHVFSKEDRAFYDLERIWRDGKQISKEDLQ